MHAVCHAEVTLGHWLPPHALRLACNEEGLPEQLLWTVAAWNRLSCLMTARSAHGVTKGHTGDVVVLTGETKL